MEKFNLMNYTKGWIVGNFLPVLFKNQDVEVAIKKYKNGDKEISHVHYISTEYTIIVTGKVLMNNILYKENDIIQINPGEYTDFNVIEDTITVVIKNPSSINDKYI